MNIWAQKLKEYEEALAARSKPTDIDLDQMVTLISDEGTQFAAPYKHLRHSKLFATLLNPENDWPEFHEKCIRCKGIPQHLLKIALDFLQWKDEREGKSLKKLVSVEEGTKRLKVDDEFPVPPELAKNLLIVADFLGC